MAGLTPTDPDDSLISEINLTPLIDIMLVLLIIFMITSSVALEGGSEVELPKQNESTQGSLTADESIVVTLDKEGKYFIKDQEVSYADLPNALTALFKDQKNKLLILAGDTRSTLGAMVELMDMAKKAGAERFAIATDTQAPVPAMK